MRNGPRFLRDSDYDGVGLLAQANGSPMAGTEGFAEVLTLGEWENAGGIGDPVPFDNDSPIMNGIVREEDGFEHFGRGFAVHENAGLNGFLELDGLLDGQQGPDADLREALDGLNNDFDIFALFVSGGEQGEVAQFGEHAAQFGLKNDEDGQYEISSEGAEEVLEDFELQEKADQDKGEQDHEKTGDDRSAAGSADEPEAGINPYREDENLQQGPPYFLEAFQKHCYVRLFKIASAIRKA
jgi:hypothetical protein